MLIMLKEIVGDDTRDRTINPQQVINVKESGPNSIIEMANGVQFEVKGTVIEITNRLNGGRKILKG